MVEAGRQELAADPVGDFLRGARDAEAIGELVRRAAQRVGDVAAGERRVDRLDLAERHAVPLDQCLRHGRQVERGLQTSGAAGRVRIVRHGRRERDAEVELGQVAPGFLRADPDVVDQERQRLVRERAGGVDAVGDLAGQAQHQRPAHRAQQQRHAAGDGPRNGEHPAVPEELAVELGRAGVEQRAHRPMRLTQPAHRVELGRVAPELLQHREIANRERGGGAATRELVERRQLLRDQQRVAQRHVRDARRQADAAGLARRGRQERPGIAVVDLVDAEDRVDGGLVGGPNRRQHLGGRCVRQQLDAHTQHAIPPRDTRSTPVEHRREQHSRCACRLSSARAKSSSPATRGHRPVRRRVERKVLLKNLGGGREVVTEPLARLLGR